MTLAWRSMSARTSLMLALPLLLSCTSESSATSTAATAPPAAAMVAQGGSERATAEDLPDVGVESDADGAVAPLVVGAQSEAAQGVAVETDGDETSGPAEEPAAPVEPITVLLIGDSLAATGFGVLLEKALDAHPNVECFRKGKSATGLARPDYFDWMGESKRQIGLRSPDVVVAIMGGNDGQDLTTRSGKGRRVHWKSEGWDAAYRGRMDDLLAQIGANGRKVVWLGLPKMGMRSLEKKLALIRAIQRDAVAALGPDGVYVETTPFLVDAAGNLQSKGKVRGKQRALRADDGIHFTMSGSQYLADRVAPAVLDAIGVDPVEP